MNATEGISLFFLVAATVQIARMIKQYIDGIRNAGDLVERLKQSPVNLYIALSIVAFMVGAVDTTRGNYIFGLAFIVFGCLAVAKGIMPYAFYQNGMVIEMDYYEWKELKSWEWLKPESKVMILHFANKPSRRIRCTIERANFEKLLMDCKKNNRS